MKRMMGVALCLQRVSLTISTRTVWPLKDGTSLAPRRDADFAFLDFLGRTAARPADIDLTDISATAIAYSTTARARTSLSRSARAGLQRAKRRRRVGRGDADAGDVGQIDIGWAAPRRPEESRKANPHRGAGQRRAVF